jgi:hypothetical protein
MLEGLALVRAILSGKRSENYPQLTEKAKSPLTGDTVVVEAFIGIHNC